MKLINKSTLVAEIEKLKGKVSDSSSYCNGWQHALRMLELSLDTLEVKEVDLEKEVEKYLLTNAAFLIGGDSKLVVNHIAKHFFKLGLKTKTYQKNK